MSEKGIKYDVHFMQLNMTRMTTSAAEFGKLSDKKGIVISNIVHKSFLDINEAGI